MVRVAIIGCQKASSCKYAAKDLGAVQHRSGTFSGIGDNEIVGYVTCGGCPGKRTLARAKMLAEIGADVIALSSSLNKDEQDGYTCPHHVKILNQLNKEFDSVVILDGTY